MEIKVHNLGGYIVKNYILEMPGALIAVDTGYPGGMQTFVKRFEKRWPLAALTHIFITHHHDDHAGFLAELLPQTQAKVVLHPLAAQRMQTGENAQPPGAGYASWMGALFGKLKKSFAYPPVVLGTRGVLVQGPSEQYFEQQGLPLRIVFLPGHTADSIGLFVPATGQMFCGDAAMNAVISPARHTIWIEDVEAFGRSWDTMLALQPKRIYPAHGTPFSPKDLVKYRHFMQGRHLRLP